MAQKPPARVTKRKHKLALPPPPIALARDAFGSVLTGAPQFAQPTTSPDPTKFTVQHGDDDPLYNLVNKALLQKIPPPRTQNLTLALATIWGSAGARVVKDIQTARQMVFHAIGDTGSVKGPQTQSLVADKMVADFTDPDPKDRPAFCFHLGDVVYSFGEAKFYYDQFYEPFRDYPHPLSPSRAITMDKCIRATRLRL